MLYAAICVKEQLGLYLPKEVPKEQAIKNND